MGAGCYPPGMTRADLAHVHGDDMQEHIECAGCGGKFYAEEAITDVVGDKLCVDCVADDFATRLDGDAFEVVAVVGGNPGVFMFEVREKGARRVE